MKSIIPNVSLGSYGYEGTVKIEAWNKLSSHRFRLTINTETINNVHKTAYNWLIDHQNEMKKLILKQLFDMYPEIQDDYGWDLNEEERAKYLPDVNSSNQLFDLIELCNIHIHDVSNDGMAYVGYELACTWEEEHGLGVMTHKNRIVAIGGADTSILSWIAEHDKVEK
ncbi:hypothetical protein PJ311_16910 [Bacillus sp. CLL-7-23]|uniref:DUF6985 domain-containing protein n=1 Tax=Bacillus changyiensis TaxID=3004103 RepID=A0ABT4X7G5_9BACI|nr:hypothetical protein [Bacillus changyiensis]MDA7028234.1 hypothetical protein [Bacillus changyiensis]